MDSDDSNPYRWLMKAGELNADTLPGATNAARHIACDNFILYCSLYSLLKSIKKVLSFVRVMIYKIFRFTLMEGIIKSLITV